jgi:hypothetical protein
MVQKVKDWIKKTPDRKVYIEVVTAILTIPVMVTVLVTNLNNLSQTKKEKEENAPVIPTATQEIIIKESANPVQQLSATTPSSCKKEVGPITISYPMAGQTITENPVPIVINYSTEEYCAVVWSYRINDGSWSEYGSNSLSLYNMPAGNKKLELRVQSTTSQDQELITREFIYSPSTQIEASQSAE